MSNLELINATDSLKFLVEKKSLKDNLKLQVAHVNGSDVKTNNKKIHDFSITKLGKRRKNMLPEPIETVIIRAQQDFDVAGGLSQIQIQISNDTVQNLLKKYKNVAYKITPIGLLFPATVTNDTNFIFVTANNISGVKKGILNCKIYNILAEINTSKINNWNETKGQSIWVNVQFKDHKEINNNSHLCFPFTTRSFSDLTSFNIFLQDGQNKKIEFKGGEKKKYSKLSNRRLFNIMVKNFRNQQKIKDEINFLLGELEKNLEDYRQTLEIKEKQLSEAKRILVSAKQSFDKVLPENRDLKAYIENLKQHFQRESQKQQLEFLKQQKTCYNQPTSRKKK